MKKIVALLLAVSATFSVLAQGTQPSTRLVGKLGTVRGLVTISSGDQLANGVSGMPLYVDSRIITTSGSEVALVYDNGCTLILAANESITVKDKVDCASLLATVSSVGATRGLGTASAASPALASTSGAPATAAVLNGQEPGPVILNSSIKGGMAAGMDPGQFR